MMRSGCWYWEVSQEDAVKFLEARVRESDATIAGYLAIVVLLFWGSLFLPVSKAKLFEPGRKLADFYFCGLLQVRFGGQ